MHAHHIGAHPIKGLGAGMVPHILDMNMLDEVIEVSPETILFAFTLISDVKLCACAIIRSNCCLLSEKHQQSQNTF